MAERDAGHGPGPDPGHDREPRPRLLAELTTLRLGGPADTLVRAGSEPELVAALREGDAGGTPLLLLAGGSNLVVSDAGFRGVVVQVATRGITVAEDRHRALVTVAAGEPWEPFVARVVQEGWCGVEALSGIPGSVGATPVQNVGAYGQELADTVVRVRCWDRRHDAYRDLTAEECGFGYRSSRFKRDPQRYVVLEVVFAFARERLGAPMRYAELARALGVEPGGRAPADRVREAVLDLRRAKGMVLDADDRDTWSAGSFFTNPLLPAERPVPPGAPCWRQPDGSVKTSAAWLIEQAGFTKGYGNDRVALSGKHTLALTNRGDGTTADLLALAGEVRRGVWNRFGIALENEPVLVGCALPEADGQALPYTTAPTTTTTMKAR